MKNNNKKGFTLLELLIVIGILAILATVAIIIINPAELLRRSRDAARISDLSSLKSSLGMYLTDVSDAELDNLTNICGTTDNGTSTWTIASIPHQTAVNEVLGSVANHANCVAVQDAGVRTATSSTYTAVNGVGWIPVDFASMSTGAPLGGLPIDPVNGCSSASAANRLFYTYSCNQYNRSFYLTARLESNYYLALSASATGYGVSNKDGGTASSVYEVGTAFNIYTAPNATTTYGVL